MIGCQRSTATRPIKKNMADAADGEDEFEAVDQRLSESQKFSLYRDLEGYRSLWNTLYVPSKNKHQNKLQKQKRLRGTVTKTQLITGLSETTDLHWQGKLKDKVTARSRNGSSSTRQTNTRLTNHRRRIPLICNKMFCCGTSWSRRW